MWFKKKPKYRVAVDGYGKYVVQAWTLQPRYTPHDHSCHDWTDWSKRFDTKKQAVDHMEMLIDRDDHERKINMRKPVK